MGKWWEAEDFIARKLINPGETGSIGTGCWGGDRKSYGAKGWRSPARPLQGGGLCIENTGQTVNRDCTALCTENGEQPGEDGPSGRLVGRGI